MSALNWACRNGREKGRGLAPSAGHFLLLLFLWGLPHWCALSQCLSSAKKKSYWVLKERKTGPSAWWGSALDTLLQEAGAAAGEIFPQTGLKMEWELELLDFGTPGWITGQNHSTLDGIRSNHPGLSKSKGIGSLFIELDHGRATSRISLYRVKHQAVITWLDSGDQSLTQTTTCMWPENPSSVVAV